MDSVDEVGIQVYKKFDKLISERSNWTSHWEELSRYILPRKDAVYGVQTVGEKKMNHLYDTTAIHSLELLASALHSMLTSPSSVWFGLSTGDRELDANDDVSKWFQQVVSIMINTMNQSNFQTEVHEVYQDLGGFGTSVLRVEEDDIDDIIFQARPIYEFAVAENYRGVVDTVYYEYEMTVQQLVEKFGEQVMTDELHKDLKENPMKKYKVLHAVEPASKFVPLFKSVNGMPFVSRHILQATKKVIRESGFHENPYIVSRWSKISGEIYGRSPGMKALADVKMMNKMMKATIEAAQLAVRPPIQSPDDGVLLPLKMHSGGINFYRAGTKDRIEPINFGGDVRLGENVLGLVAGKIEQAFFIDQLKTREADRQTATEVMQRRDEQLRTLSPILGRQQHEYLKPLVERVYKILDRKGKFPPAPDAITDKPLQVQYVSLIAKAQKAAEGDALSRTLNMVAPLIEIEPTIMQNFDTDEIARFASDINGLPHQILRDVDDRDEIRQQQAEQQAQQEQVEQDNTQADTANKLKDVPNV